MSQYPRLPSFKQIDSSQMPQQLSQLLKINLEKLDKLTTIDAPSWNNVMRPMHDIEIEFERKWSPFSHLNNVCNSDEIRASYNNCIIQLSQYSATVGQNKQLFKTIETIYQTDPSLTAPQKKALEHSLRDFKLAGVALDSDKKKQYQKLTQQLAELTTKFSENVMDATDAWTYHTEDQNELAGLPELAIESAKNCATQKDLTGYLITLQIPSYLPIMQYAENRSLREAVYKAYCTRASNQGPNAGQFDNSDIMQQILKCRLSLSKLLDFDHFGEYSLATKMAPDTKTVFEFLWQLVEKSKPKAAKEFTALQTFAANELKIDQLQPWDLSFAAEKLKQQKYAISDHELRPYFPAPKVISGLFTIVNRLFQVEIRAITDFDTWHNDVLCYGIYKNDELISAFYFDLYARAKKQGGAWMDDCQNLYFDHNSERQIPIAFVTCNFDSPTVDRPALLSHNDVITLFHEFGHALQHMLTEVDCLDVTGINGVPWDAVEICSQFLENWAWQKECMPLISSHYQTGETLPDALFDKMQRARQFHAALQMCRQLELALFDFTLHCEFNGNDSQQIQTVLNHIRDKVSVIPTADYNRFQHGFSHIFAGGYAAGYYSYKWAEVMSADAFSLFLENGIFDSATSQSFYNTFLASGGSVEPMDLFIQFRGRKPSVDALLQQDGIIERP